MSNIGNPTPRTVTINGQTHVADLAIDELAKANPVTLALWASTWEKRAGDAKAQAALADAHYRAWRAQKFQALAQASGKAPTEAAAKADCEADPSFLEHKRTVAKAELDAFVCECNARLLSQLSELKHQSLTMSAMLAQAGGGAPPMPTTPTAQG